MTEIKYVGNHVNDTVWVLLNTGGSIIDRLDDVERLAPPATTGDRVRPST